MATIGEQTNILRRNSQQTALIDHETGKSQTRLAYTELTATGTISNWSGLVTLNHASTIIAATFASTVTLEVGATLWIVNTSASGTAAHHITLPSGFTFSGGSNNRATLDAPQEALLCVVVSSAKVQIVVNLGSVALSAV